MRRSDGGDTVRYPTTVVWQRSEATQVKFTVCVPTVRPTTLRRTVQSILAQTWPEWELLVIGQGQDADLGQAGNQLAALDSRIRYIHLDQKGLSRRAQRGTAHGHRRHHRDN